MILTLFCNFSCSDFRLLAQTGISCVSQKSNAWTIDLTKECPRHQMLILLFKNSLKISNCEKSPKTSRNQILDFWLTRDFRVSAKSLTPERLKLHKSVLHMKCLFYYLKISNFEKSPKTSKNLEKSDWALWRPQNDPKWEKHWF